MGFPEQPEMALSKNGSNIINQLDFVYPTCSDKPIHNIDCKLKTPLYPIIMYNNNSIMVYIYIQLYIYTKHFYYDIMRVLVVIYQGSTI